MTKTQMIHECLDLEEILKAADIRKKELLKEWNFRGYQANQSIYNQNFSRLSDLKETMKTQHGVII